MLSHSNIHLGDIAVWEHPRHAERKVGKLRQTYQRLCRLLLEHGDLIRELPPHEIDGIDQALLSVEHKLWRLRLIATRKTPTRNARQQYRGEERTVIIPRTSHRGGTALPNHTVKPRSPLNAHLKGGLDRSTNAVLLSADQISHIRVEQHQRCKMLVNALMEEIFGNLRAEEVTEMWDADDEARDLRVIEE